MKKRMILGLCILLFLGMAAGAGATIVTDPTDLTDSTIDVDFDTTFPDTVANISLSGEWLFLKDTAGYQAPIDYPDYVAGFANMLLDGQGVIEFAAPVSEIGFGVWDPNFVGTGYEVFDTAGYSLSGFIQSPTGPTGGSFATYVGWVADSAVIASVVFTSLGTDFVGIDNISFNPTADPVPEPATMLLFGAGLIGLVGIRHKKS